MEHEKSLERVKGEQRETDAWPTQSQEHVYEFEGLTSFNQSVEATYAEVGPLDVMVYTGHCMYNIAIHTYIMCYTDLNTVSITAGVCVYSVYCCCVK